MAFHIIDSYYLQISATMGEVPNDIDLPNFNGEGTKAKKIFEELGRLLPVSNILI